jgi:hypothetical protein
MSNEDEVELGMSLPLDSDSFLRRECPTCEREFKAFVDPDEDDDGEAGSDDGYFCPYCGVQAPGDAWWTEAQLGLAEKIVATRIVGPALQDFGNSIKDLGRRSGGFLQATVEYDEPKEADPLTEDDDMKRVDFDCHDQPIKVLDDWRKPVRCFICGEASEAA